MKSCIFCGQRAGSAEHIIATCLAERMGLTRLQVRVGQYKEGEGASARPAHLLNGYTTRSVCKKCNNGWMSELEKWFNETLGSMIEPNAPFPSNEQLEAVVKNEERLTRWLLKTTVTVQQSSMFKEKDIVPKSLLPLIQNGPLPSDLWVELGWSEDARLDHRLIKGHPIINGGVFHQNQVHQDGFRFILQLNHLLLRIYRIPGAAPVLVVEQPVVVRGSREPRSVMSTMFFQGIWDFDRSLVISTGSL